MANLLVVDDSNLDRLRAGGLLQKETDWRISYASNGREALESMQRGMPDAVICDLQMPEMNGLELVEAVKREFPAIPVILMTARGSEEIAAEALRKGAASYVPKSRLADNLYDTVNRILAAAGADRMHSRLMHSLEEAAERFRLRNDLELIEPLVGHMQELLRCVPLGNESERLRVGVALKHAILIAHHHGNLEIPLNVELPDEEFLALASSRRDEEPYASRSVVIQVRISADSAQFDIRHDGPGLPEFQTSFQLDSEAIDRQWLSGFVLVASVMDRVTLADNGRTITLFKKAVSSDGDLELGEDGSADENL